MKIIIDFSPEEKEIIVNAFETQVFNTKIENDKDFILLIRTIISKDLENFYSYIDRVLIDAYLQILAQSDIYNKLIKNYKEDDIIYSLLHEDFNDINDSIEESIKNKEYFVIEKSKYPS